MTATNNASRPGYKIEDILVAHPPRYIPWMNRHPSIEDTGRGTTLCFESWGSRFFYSDEGAVHESINKFCEDYRRECELARNDPTTAHIDVFNFNDLYVLLGIVPTPFGDAWGYNTCPDYARDVRFRVYTAYPTQNKIADLFGCQILIIEPEEELSYPDYYDREM